MPYFACYNYGRYSVIHAPNREAVIPTSFDFKIAPYDFDTYESCSELCRALNIHLRDNYEPEETELEVE